MTDLQDIQKRIDIKITELRQLAHFALNKYDYHHKNDELQIIRSQMDILGQVATVYTTFLNEMQKFNQKLHDAKQLSSQFEQLLQSQQTTQPQAQIERPNVHETMTKATSTTTTPQPCIKDKSKDTIPKKQLFPPA